MRLLAWFVVGPLWCSGDPGDVSFDDLRSAAMEHRAKIRSWFYDLGLANDGTAEATLDGAVGSTSPAAREALKAALLLVPASLSLSLSLCARRRRQSSSVVVTRCLSRVVRHRQSPVVVEREEWAGAAFCAVRCAWRSWASPRPRDTTASSTRASPWSSRDTLARFADRRSLVSNPHALQADISFSARASEGDFSLSLSLACVCASKNTYDRCWRRSASGCGCEITRSATTAPCRRTAARRPSWATTTTSWAGTTP